jgi:predicted 3-demethylubiquinone-9 3-methyltransferase (glyoxalase superfamily)
VQKITPFLWFDGKAEEAANFYVSIFKNSKILGVSRYGEVGPGPKGSVMVIRFALDGQEFCGLNGGPHFTFSPAISFAVSCANQQEIDELWDKLSDGGQTQQCGWLKDKYGVSWQIVPANLGAMVEDAGGEKTDRVMKAVVEMEKFDLDRLRRAQEAA